jgi:hypothetical protein
MVYRREIIEASYGVKEVCFRMVLKTRVRLDVDEMRRNPPWKAE